MNRRFTIASVAGVCMLLSGCGGETNRTATTDNTPPAKEVTGAEPGPAPEGRKKGSELLFYATNSS